MDVNDPLDRIASALERIADMLEQRQEVSAKSGGTGRPPGGGG
jgi:hypothetical protein